jgi:hypothetical protein
MTGASTVPVTISEWQFSCCGKPFAIGDEVRWTLEFIDLVDRPAQMYLQALVRLTDEQPLHDDQSSSDESGAVVRVGEGVVAWMASPPPALSAVEMRGALLQEHHGGVPQDVPSTRGVVRRIRVVIEEFRTSSDERHGRYWSVVPGTATFRDVPRTPDGLWTPPPEGEEPHRQVTGILVDLEIMRE